MLSDYLGLSRAVYILCLGTFVNRAGSMIVPFLTIYLQRQLPKISLHPVNAEVRRY